MHCRTAFGRVVMGLSRTTLRRVSKIHRRGYAASSDGVIKSPYGTMNFPDARLHDVMYENFDKFGSRLAVECGLTGRKYTYSKLIRFSNALAASIRNKLKLAKGDAVAVYLPNVPEYPIIFLAGSQSGVIVTTVNSSYTAAEVGRQVEASGAKAVFTTIALYPVIQSALKIIQKNYPVFVIRDDDTEPIPPGAGNFMELLDSSTCGALGRVDVSQDDVLVLPYSSGTTGLPKGVQLMHRNLVSNILQTADAKARIKFNVMSEAEENVLGLLPMFHIYGMTCVTFTTLYAGGTLVTLPRFDPLYFLEVIITKKINMLYLVPPLILFLSNHSIVKPSYLKNVRCVINGASPIGASDVEKFLLKGKHIVCGQGYGMTETSPVVLLVNSERTNKYGGCGVPVISTDVKIVDPDTMEPKGKNEIGEIWVRGPQVMKGYLNNQKATDEMMVDGWLRTGDLAYYDDDGDFFIADRMKDLIKVKGFQVAPAELEELLRTHPNIIDAAVIGVPDDKKGEVPKAFVVLRDGMKASEEEIKSFIKGKVAKYKELEGGVVFVKSIPKSPAGKILKKDLRDS